MQHKPAGSEQPEAGPSSPRLRDGEASGSSSEYESGEDDEEEERFDGLGEGMDPEGFAGEKVVKPLTAEALAAFKAAQDRAGVIYISRIPPGMRPAKVRHLMSGYGEVGRVYLQQEGVCLSSFSFDRQLMFRRR
jgi:ESF2/ABP1 family protein